MKIPKNIKAKMNKKAFDQATPSATPCIQTQYLFGEEYGFSLGVGYALEMLRSDKTETGIDLWDAAYWLENKLKDKK